MVSEAPSNSLSVANLDAPVAQDDGASSLVACALCRSNLLQYFVACQPTQRCAALRGSRLRAPYLHAPRARLVPQKRKLVESMTDFRTSV